MTPALLSVLAGPLRLLWPLLLVLLPSCAPSGSAGDATGAAETGTALAATPAPAPLPDSAFAALVAGLSEPGGYFDTDNLISNESSYLHVVGALEALGVEGGAYIGVGPDQNFSYMGVIRPEMAYIVDIRRDNLLQHLWLKTLFELAPTRVEYLSLMFARPAPAEPEAWADADLDDLVRHVDGTSYDRALEAANWERVAAAVQDHGVPLTVDEVATVGAIAHRFAEEGLGLRFTSHYRGPRPYYPTYRDLMLETDLEGRPMNYLASEDTYAWLRQMQLDNRVVPVVGNLAGDHALAAIGRDAAGRGLTVSGFYTSNVEFYLWRDGSFPTYAATVEGLPRSEASVIIRSYFNRFDMAMPQSRPGYASTQLLQGLDDFARARAQGGFRGYRDLVTRDAVPVP